MGCEGCRLCAAPPQACPAGSTPPLLDGGAAPPDTSMVFARGLLEAEPTCTDLSAAAEARLEVGMCFTLAGGGSSESARITGLAPVRFVGPRHSAYPTGSTLTLLEGASFSSHASTVLMCGPIDAGTMLIDLPAEVETLLQVGVCYTLTGGDYSGTACIAGSSPLQLMSLTQFARPACSWLTPPEGVSVFSNSSKAFTRGQFEAGATSRDLST